MVNAVQLFAFFAVAAFFTIGFASINALSEKKTANCAKFDINSDSYLREPSADDYKNDPCFADSPWMSALIFVPIGLVAIYIIAKALPFT